MMSQHTIAIAQLGRATQWRDACLLLDRMQTASGLRPNIFSYSAAISACEKGGQWQQALTLFQDMLEGGIRHDIISYNATISACEKGGQWQRALTLFQELPEATMSPNVISYNAAINACEKGGQWQQALLLFQIMPEVGSSNQVPPNPWFLDVFRPHFPSFSH